MSNKFCKFVGGILTALAFNVVLWHSVVWAACAKGEIETSLFGCVKDDGSGSAVFMILNIILNVLTYGVGTLAVFGLTLAGYHYATSKDSPEKMQKAKNMVMNVVIGLVIYALLYALLQWLIPGGTK